MSQVKSIKCTNCAAPLNLLGGGRIESVTCSYCNSVLDLNNHYKVLSNFKNVKELHKLPFEVGMTGKVKETDYTIIGRVTYTHTEYPHGEWTDFLLFSPLYGYAWLTYEEGHLIYSKRERYFPSITWSKIAEQSSIAVKGNSYTPFDRYEAKVTFVEGELTWIAKHKDKVSFIDMTNPPYGVSAEKSRDEIEYYKEEYLDADSIYKAFSIETENPPTGFHALQPFERPFLKALSLIAFWSMFIIALLAVAVSIDGRGKIIKQVTTTNIKSYTTNFDINSSKYLVDLELQSYSTKELNNFNLKIHQNQQLLFSLTPHAAYIFQENNKVQKKLKIWEKHAKKVRVLLNLPAGKGYTLSIQSIDQNLSSTLFVKIKEAHSKLNYFIWFFFLTVILWILYKFFTWRYNSKLTDEQGIYQDDDQYIWTSEDKSWDSSPILQITFYLFIFSILIILEYMD